MLQAADLPVVLDQPQLVDDGGQLVPGPLGQERIEEGIVAGEQGALLVAPGLERAGQVGQGAAVHGQDGSSLLRGRDVAHPDRTEPVVGEVALGAGVLVGADVEGGVMAGAIGARRHHQDASLRGLAGEPDER
jgi:hypothetical protein